MLRSLIEASSTRKPRVSPASYERRRIKRISFPLSRSDRHLPAPHRCSARTRQVAMLVMQAAFERWRNSTQVNVRAKVTDSGQLSDCSEGVARSGVASGIVLLLGTG